MKITLIFEIFQDKIKKFGLTKKKFKKIFENFFEFFSNIYLVRIDFLDPKFHRIHDNHRYINRHRADGPWQT